MGTYDTLLLAFDMDQRVDEAESLWNMILHRHTRSISKQLFARMISLYDHHNIPGKIIEVHANCSSLTSHLRTIRFLFLSYLQLLHWVTDLPEVYDTDRDLPREVSITELSDLLHIQKLNFLKTVFMVLNYYSSFFLDKISGVCRYGGVRCKARWRHRQESCICLPKPRSSGQSEAGSQEVPK